MQGVLSAIQWLKWLGLNSNRGKEWKDLAAKVLVCMCFTPEKKPCVDYTILDLQPSQIRWLEDSHAGHTISNPMVKVARVKSQPWKRVERFSCKGAFLHVFHTR